MSRFPIVLGHEFSGVVAALGPGVARIAAGDPVYGVNDFIGSGAQAEYVVAKAGELAPKPQTLDHVHAAVVPISALTAWQGLFDHGDLRAGQRVLIQGAAGAVGSFALQLARWRGASTIATATGAGLELARSLGADTGERALSVLRRGGKLVSIAVGSRDAANQAVRDTFFIFAANRTQLMEIGRLLDAGQLQPLVDRVFPLEQARAAYARAQAGGVRGKIVLQMDT